MVLRWFKNATDLPTLARDGRVSIATAYRYVHEAIDVIAAHAPDLPEVLAHGLQQGWTFCCLDGTPIPSVRSAAPSEAGHDVWYSGKHHRHGGNIQVLTGPAGYPEWVSDVEPGSTHDITAARIHALPRRTRQRLAQTNLESTRTHHPRSLENRRHHYRRPRPTPPSATSPVRKPQCGLRARRLKMIGSSSPS